MSELKRSIIQQEMSEEDKRFEANFKFLLLALIPALLKVSHDKEPS